METKLSYIQRVVDHGISVLPLSQDGKPMLGGGYAAASAKTGQVNDWIDRFPNCNWGIRTGKESGIVVIDLDPRNGSAETVLQLKRDGKTLPSTYTVQSARKGLHLYYRLPEGMEITSHTNLLPGLDVIADGKYIVAGYSTNQHGTYIPTSNDFEFALLPVWLLDLIKEKNSSTLERTNTALIVHSDVHHGELSKATLKFLLDGAVPGEWNSSLFKSAKDFQEQGYPIEDAIERLSNVTGYLDKTDNKTIQSAYRRAPRYEPRDVFPDQSEGKGVEEIAEEKVELITPRSLFQSVRDYLADKDSIRGVGTGLEPFDNLLGGFRPGEIVIFHAETKNGKSTLFHKIIHCLLTAGHKIGYASREMDPNNEVLPALFSVEGQFNAWTESFNLKLDEIKWIDDLYFAPGYGYFPLNELIKWFEQAVQLGVSVIFYDHLHFGLPNPEKHEDAAIYIRELKTLAKKYKVPVVVVVQANKLMEGMKLGKNSVKGGAAIVQAADALFVLEKLANSPHSNAQNIMKVELIEKRHPLSKLGTFYLQYDERTTDLIVADLVPEENPTPENVFNLGRKKY